MPLWQPRINGDISAQPLVRTQVRGYGAGRPICAVMKARLADDGEDDEDEDDGDPQIPLWKNVQAAELDALRRGGLSAQGTRGSGQGYQKR